MTEWEIIEADAQQELIKYPDWRYGQALFNSLYEYHPDIANRIRGTQFDCFHRDSLVDAFKNEVIKLLNE